MTANIRSKLISFIKDVKQLAPGPGPVRIRSGAMPYELTFYSFVLLWYDRSIQVITEDSLHPMQDVIDVLRKEHQDQVLNAISQGHTVPTEVLKEYRFRHEFYKPIRTYCRANKIDLDA